MTTSSLPPIEPSFVPKLAKKARLRFDHHAHGYMLVYPERGLALNDSAAEIAARCDGTRSIAEIAEELAELAGDRAARDGIEVDVLAFVRDLGARGLLDLSSTHVSEDDKSATPLAGAQTKIDAKTRRAGNAPRPYTLIAELTYRCPLRCPYCSNPTNLAEHEKNGELATAEWQRVLEQASELGVVQVHFTGGEPLARKDLEELVTTARDLGMFSNLVTSGIPLTKARLEGLAAKGIDHVQVSIQSARADRSDRIAGYPSHPQKIEVMRWVRELGLPLTMNVVLHSANLDEIEELVALAEDVGAERLELANTQYVSWALSNRDMLMPTREQLDRAAVIAYRHRDRLRGKMDVLFVKPDYFGTTPKACMDGWARRFIHMVPDGRVLPCHAATSITSLTFDNVKARSLEDIWTSSEALLAYRGDAWMQEPCRSCDRRAADFGGCRCQAFALTGDAAATDPACHLSPRHSLIEAARKRAPEPSDSNGHERRYLYRGRSIA